MSDDNGSKDCGIHHNNVATIPTTTKAVSTVINSDNKHLMNFCSGNLKFNVVSLKMSKKEFLGKEYTVLPATIIKEGAFYPEGSDPEKGALFVSSDAIEKSALRWNGRGVSLNHPTNDTATLNTPTDYNNQYLGLVFNSRYSSSEKAIKTEFWLDSERAKPIIDKIKSGDKIDVSIGAYGTFGNAEGNIGNTYYGHSFENIKPDHVAILPFSDGACSYEHGCGIRAKKTPEKIKEQKKEMAIKMNDSKNNCDETLSNDVDSHSIDNIKSLLCHASPELRKSIQMAMLQQETAKADVIDKINAIGGVSFCDKFFEKNSTTDLSKIVALADAKVANLKKIEDTEMERNEKDVAKTNFSLKTPARNSREDLDYVAIPNINLLDK